MMPTLHGGDVAWQLASDPETQSIQIIICSGAEREEITRRLPLAKIPILEKPLDTEELLRLLRENVADGVARSRPG
jgi:CheY-like chemotaxis protein